MSEVVIRPARDEEHPLRHVYTYGHLQSLMVTAAHRRSGIGQQLMAAAENWAREHGASELRLEMWEFAAGPLRFYEKQGYMPLRRVMVRRLT